MRKIVLPYWQAKPLLKSGDLLFFANRGIIPFLIQKSGYTSFNHVGLVEITEKSALLLEFREFRGYIESELDNRVNPKYNIDVLRPKPNFELSYLTVNKSGFEISKELVHYDAAKTIETFRTMKGMPYGWRRIFLMMMRHIPFIRLFTQPYVDDLSEPDYVFPVCSTSITTVLRKTYIDPVPFMADYCVEPGDLSRSVIFDYLFTIGAPSDQ